MTKIKDKREYLKLEPIIQNEVSQKEKHQYYSIQCIYKKDLHDQDNHDGVITHLEPDTLECKVKWALGSITTNKARGGDGIPVAISNPER